MRIALASAIAGMILVVSTGTAAANVCVTKRIKSLARTCGSVIDAVGEPIPNAKVTILKDGTEVAETQTDDGGKFSFETLKEGTYEIRVRANGFQTFGFRIVAVKPARKCKRTLRITLSVGYSSCAGDVQLIKP